MKERYKICKSCGAKNSINEFLCIECMGRDFETNNTPKESKSVEVKYKICISCGVKNRIDNKICNSCLGSEFEVLEEKKEEFKTVIEQFKELNISIDGKNFIITDETIVGREATLSEILSNYTTVSREHLKFIYKNRSWRVIDLNSTNGSFLNSVRLNPNQEYLIEAGNELKLSTKITIIILESKLN